MKNPWLLEREETLLLVVDIQDRLAAVMEDRESVVGNTCKLIAAAKVLGVPMVVTEQYPEGLGGTVQEIQDCLEAGTPLISKMTFRSGDEAGVRDALAHHPDRRTILVAGMEAHVCVYQTSLDLIAREYAVHVAADAVCSRRRQNREVALESLARHGAIVTTAESAIFQLTARADIPEFKEILKIVK